MEDKGGETVFVLYRSFLLWHRTTMKPLTILLAGVLPLLLSLGCASTSSEVGETGATGESEESSEELEEKERELLVARLELKGAELGARTSLAAAATEVVDATHTLERATEALAHYTEVEVQRSLAEKQLELDDAVFDLEQEQRALTQMTEDYAGWEKDPAAKKTAEIVIWRYETQIEHATRRLEFAKQDQVQLETYTIPRRTKELAAELREAEEASKRAEESVEETRVESELSVLRAKQSVEELERELAELKE
jgi:hypothetical protein